MAKSSTWSSTGFLFCLHPFYPGADRWWTSGGDGEPDGGGDSWGCGGETQAGWPQRTRGAGERAEETRGRGDKKEQWRKSERWGQGEWTDAVIFPASYRQTLVSNRKIIKY